MELTTLAVWIYGARQIGEQGTVEGTLRKGAVELSGIDANEPRREAIAHEPLGEAGGIDAPEREQRLEARSGEKIFPITSDVLEK